MSVIGKHHHLIHSVGVLLTFMASAGPVKADELDDLAQRASQVDQSQLVNRVTKGTRESGPIVQLAPNARIGRMSRVAIPLSGSRKKMTYQFTLQSGRADIELSGRRQQDVSVRHVDRRLVELPQTGGEPIAAVLVRAPNGQVAIVVNGSATVEVRNGDLSVFNRKGKTLVGTVKSVKPLMPGFAQSFGCSANGGMREMVSKPLVLPGQRVWLSPGSKPIRPRAFSWNRSNGAERYLVRVTDVIKGQPVATFETEETSMGEQAPAIHPGKYNVSIVPIDGCGLHGDSSNVAELSVVGVGLPLGAYIDNQGAIRSVVNRPLRLTHADGVFMSYSDTGVWGPAPASVRLVGREMNLRFRSTDLRHPTQMRIVPRDVHASIEMTPPTARWPEHSIDVKVTLGTGKHGPAPRWLKPRIKVMLGVKQIHVPWKRSGDVMRTTIPPQGDSCPCVIRVQVEDQYGISIGRDFLEVSRSDT